MNIKSLLLVILLNLSYQQLKASENVELGKQLYFTYCSVCHGQSKINGMNNRLAPPIIAVKKHYIDSFSNEQSFVKAISEWVAKPDESKTLMPGAIRRFKIMPPIPLPKNDMEKIASYIFKGDIAKPKGFDKHYQDEHHKSKNEK